MLDFHQKLIIAERENVVIPTNLELRRSPRIDILKYKKKIKYIINNIKYIKYAIHSNV